MKKILTCASVLLLAAPAAQADMLGVYGGIQGWFPTVDGGYGADKNFDDYSFNDASNITGYIKFEHPLPLIPNVKLRHTTYDAEAGKNTANIDLTSMEYTFYYELLDFDVASVDAGFTIRNIDGELTNSDGTQTLDEYIPAIYVAASTALPFTNVSVFADVNYSEYDGNDVSDMQLGIGYTFVDNLAIDLTAQLGYRVTSIDLDNVDDINGELDFEGVFVGLEAHF